MSTPEGDNFLKFAHDIGKNPIRTEIFNPHLGEDIRPEVLAQHGIAVVSLKDKFPYQDCFAYVFKTVKAEPNWDPNRFYVDSQGWMAEAGYIFEAEPEDGDVVAYVCDRVSEAHPVADDSDFITIRMNGIAKPPFIAHVGIYSEEKVISKFGSRGHVYSHNLELVPYNYGTKIYFLRKK